MRNRGLWTVCAASLVLAACEQVVVNAPATNPRYFGGEESYAARNGALRVEVAGATLGVPQDRFTQMVVAEMRRGNTRLPRPGFVAESSPMTDPRYKVVMMFDAPAWLSADNLCSDRPPPPAPHAPGERLRLLASFCRAGEASSEAHGSAPVSAGVDDPNFAALVRQVTLNLFPTHDDRHDSDVPFH
jgi:hypothetical protein